MIFPCLMISFPFDDFPSLMFPLLYFSFKKFQNFRSFISDIYSKISFLICILQTKIWIILLYKLWYAPYSELVKEDVIFFLIPHCT